MSTTDYIATSSVNNVEESSNKINKNVVFTKFELETMCPHLSSSDEDGVIIREFTVKSVYGMNIYDKEVGDDEGNVVSERIKFLSVEGRFKNSNGTLLSVSIIVVDDKRFYMSLNNPDDNKQALFINSSENMRFVLDNMSSSMMSDEDISKELLAIESM